MRIRYRAMEKTKKQRWHIWWKKNLIRNFHLCATKNLPPGFLVPKLKTVSQPKKIRAQSPFTIQTSGSRTPTPLRELEQEAKKGKKNLESFCAVIVQAARAIQPNDGLKVDESSGKFFKGVRDRQDPVDCIISIDEDRKACALAFMTKKILPSKSRGSASQTGISKLNIDNSKMEKLQEEIWKCGSIFDKSRRSMYELMASDSHRRFIARIAGMSN
mmetsp:Transcript_29207/g.40717  ORF Transcript_29207/g.40717 Transcript_29207/m.40717 type:complete len:216 (-) Transcript_29207:357-1004(-)